MKKRETVCEAFSVARSTKSFTASALVPISLANRSFICAIFLAIFLATAMVHLFQGDVSPGLLIWLLVFLFASVVPLVTHQSVCAWFHPIAFGCLYSVVDLLRSFPIYAWGLDYHHALSGFSRDQLNHLLSIELMLMTVGLVTYYAGFAFCRPTFVPQIRFVKPRHLGIKLVIAQLIGVIFFVLLMRERGGLSAHVESWGIGRSTAFAGSLVFVLLPFLKVGIFSLLLYLAFRPKSLYSPVFWSFVALSLTGIFLATGSRSSVIAPLVIIFMIVMLRRRSFSMAMPIATVMVGLFVLTTLGDFRRSTFQSSGPDWNILTSLDFFNRDLKEITLELTNRSGVARGSLPILQDVPDQVSYLHGESYLAALLLPVPRKVWPDKPRQIGGRVGATFFGVQAGIPPGAVGEAYWNFGYLGVPLIYFMFGGFHRWLMQFFLKYQRMPVAIVFYAVSLFVFRIPASNAFVGYALSLASLLLVALLFGLVSLSSRSSGSHSLRPGAQLQRNLITPRV